MFDCSEQTGCMGCVNNARLLSLMLIRASALASIKSDQAYIPNRQLIQHNTTIPTSISACSTTNASKIPCLQLCPQQVAESIAEPMACWIRFLGNETTAPTVELAIQIQVVAANPVAWGMAIVAGASQPTPRDQGEVQCGQPFRLEIVAHDKYSHR